MLDCAGQCLSRVGRLRGKQGFAGGVLAGPGGVLAGPGGALAGPGLVFFQHDEVIVHCPQAVAAEVVGAIGDAAQEAGRLVFGATPVRFPVTTAVVDCYADAK